MLRADVAAFVEETRAMHVRAEVALHTGDAAGRLSLWSRQEPITVFGAGVPYRGGWRDVSETFRWVGSTFTACHGYDFEVLAADVSSDLAYTVGFERYRATRDTGDVVDHALRVTHIYRRESNDWKVVHRHGDHVPTDVSQPPPHDSRR